MATAEQLIARLQLVRTSVGCVGSARLPFLGEHGHVPWPSATMPRPSRHTSPLRRSGGSLLLSAARLSERVEVERRGCLVLEVLEGTAGRPASLESRLSLLLARLLLPAGCSLATWLLASCGLAHLIGSIASKGIIT